MPITKTQNTLQVILDDVNTTDEVKMNLVSKARADACHDELIQQEFPVVEEVGDVTVSILELSKHGDSGVHMIVSAKRNGEELLDDQEFVVINPPIAVPDPAGDITIGEGENAITFREDPAAALRQSIIETVKTKLGI